MKCDALRWKQDAALLQTEDFLQCMPAHALLKTGSMMIE